MKKSRIKKILAVLALGSIAATVTTGVFISQENILIKEIKTLKNRRLIVKYLKDRYPKYSQEINQLLFENLVTDTLADESIPNARQKIKNLDIEIDKILKNITQNNKKTLDRSKYNLLSKQVNNYLDDISKTNKYKKIYDYLKGISDLTKSNINKEVTAQANIDSETLKLNDTFDKAKDLKDLKDKLDIANDFQNTHKDSEQSSIKDKLQKAIGKGNVIYNDENSTGEQIKQSTKDLKIALKNANDEINKIDNKDIVESQKYLEYQKTLSEAKQYKNQLSQTPEYNKPKQYLEKNIDKATKDSNGQMITKNTSDEELDKAINLLHKTVSDTAKQVFNTVISLAKIFINDFSDDKYPNFKNEVEELLNKYNQNVDSKTNQQLQNQSDEILDVLKAQRLRADKKYDEILQFANFFIIDLNENETTKVKYSEIISELTNVINTQNAIRNNPLKSARDVLNAKDALLDALNKASVDKKILDSGNKEDISELAFENYKKQRQQLQQYKDSLDSSKYSDIQTKIANTITQENLKVTLSPADTDKPKSDATNDDIKQATEVLKQALNNAQNKVSVLKNLEAQKAAYDAVIDEVNTKLTDPKYNELKEAFKIENKPNQDIRDTEQTDKQKWANDIQNSIPKTQQISKQIDAVLPKFDALDTKRTEVQTTINKLPSDNEYDEIRNNLQSALDNDANKNEEIIKLVPIFDTTKWDKAISTLDQVIKDSNTKKSKTEKKKQFKDKKDELINLIDDSQTTYPLNGKNELNIINETEELLKMQDSDLDALTPSEIQKLIEKMDSNIIKFNDDTKALSDLWETDYANKLSEAADKNIGVTLDNIKAGATEKNSLLWYMSNNEEYPKQKWDYGFSKFDEHTKSFAKLFHILMSNAHINGNNNLDKYIYRTLSKAVEEISVILSSLVLESKANFDKNTVLIKYLRRYYGSNLSNEQYGLWSELASHKLVPTIKGHLILEDYYEPENSTVDDPNFSQFAARFNSYTIKNPHELQSLVSIFQITKWRRLPSLVLSWIHLHDGTYPIFKKSLDYVIETYKYLKPGNIQNHLANLMENKSENEKLAIRKAIAVAKAKFTSILEKMNLQNEPTTVEDDSVYQAKFNNNMQELENRLSNDSYSYTTKTYLKQVKNYVLSQFSSTDSFFDKNYTLEHAIQNFDTIVDPNTSSLVLNEDESILDPVNMNQVIESYAILVDLTNKYLDKTKYIHSAIDWLNESNPHDNGMGEPTNSDNSNGLKNQNKPDTTDSKYATYPSSKYTFKKNVTQKLDFVNRKLLTTYSSDDQTQLRNKLQSKYSAWIQKFNEISTLGDSESAYEELLNTILKEYKEVVNKDLNILEK